MSVYCTPHMYSSCCKGFYVDCIILDWVSRTGSLSPGIFMPLITHSAQLNMIWPNQLKSLFVYSGQNWSFCRYWNNGVDQCVGSCLPVSCDVWKELRICRDFHSSSPQSSLAACKAVRWFFKTLKSGCWSAETEDWVSQKSWVAGDIISCCLFVEAVVPAIACFRINKSS